MENDEYYFKYENKKTTIYQNMQTIVRIYTRKQLKRKTKESDIDFILRESKSVTIDKKLMRISEFSELLKNSDNIHKIDKETFLKDLYDMINY